MTHEQALALDRARILADLHDGLGASLIGLLRLVQAGHTDPALSERRVREALLEMRIAIDALRPHENDLETVLGNLRYRLDETILGSGMQLQWNVEELPPVGNLDPSAVFSVQRILLEAITNALKHSGAMRMRISARALGADHIEVCVADDGRGFDPTQRSSGVGLSTMRARARGLGAQVDIESLPSRGTTVRLSVPRRLVRQATGSGTTGTGVDSALSLVSRLGTGSA